MIDELKTAMIRAAKRAYDIRLQSGNGGNLSIRISGEDRILIKASGCSFGNMSDGMVLTDMKGKSLEGSGKPSREIKTHLEIYNRRPDVMAIFHSHSPWAVSCAQEYDMIPDISLPMAMKIGAVPVLDAGGKQADSDVADAVGQLLLKHPGIRAFVQRRHGLFCLAEDIEAAEYDAELVEEASQIAVLSRLMAISKR